MRGGAVRDLLHLPGEKTLAASREDVIIEVVVNQGGALYDTSNLLRT